MRWLRRMLWVGLLALAGWQTPLVTPGQEAAPKVELKVVKYPGLCDLINANKGKVILVDFWNDSCLPCKRAFPHMVELYKKYASKGLVVISVSTDDLHDEDRKDPEANILKFLQAKNAIFTNVVLDESTEFLKDKLRIYSIPRLYVFNREGQWQMLYGDRLTNEKNEVRHDEIETLVKKLLD